MILVVSFSNWVSKISFYLIVKFSPILLSAPAMLPTMAGNMDRQSDSKRHKQPQKRYVIRQSHKVMRPGLT